MFVQSMKFIDEHKGNKKAISVYGQEYTATTRKLALMNLAIRGINANLGEKAASTFTCDLHKDLKADYALMNPPFNQKGWREENELTDDARWKGYDVPPTTCYANYAWILNMISKLSQNGIGCLLLANGALSSDGVEYSIRKQLIENDLVEAIIVLPNRMFYSTDISVTIWIFNKNKHERIEKKNGEDIHFRERSNEVLFMDLRHKGHPFEKKYVEFTIEDRKSIVETYHNWRTKSKYADYKNIKEYCYSARKDEIEKNDYSLVTSKYIKFNKSSRKLDFEEDMRKIQTELSNIFEEESILRAKIMNVLEEIGYGINS